MVVYTNEENIIICKAYVNASQDPIAGVDQRATVFQSKVFQNYTTLMNGDNGRSKRNIHEQAKNLIKFCKRYECHHKVINSTEYSGRNEDDVQRFVIKKCMTDPDTFRGDKCFKFSSSKKNQGRRNPFHPGLERHAKEGMEQTVCSDL